MAKMGRPLRFCVFTIYTIEVLSIDPKKLKKLDLFEKPIFFFRRRQTPNQRERERERDSPLIQNYLKK